MSRTQRLLDLIQILRGRHYPVSAAVLASELGVSKRTVYRDVVTLQGQGAPIDGEAGVGYLLRPGFLLPPLMFTEEEIQSLVLGARWVSARADSELGRAARSALARIGAVLPERLKNELEYSGLLVARGTGKEVSRDLIGTIRRAITSEKKLSISYRNEEGLESERRVWPFALGFFEQVDVLAAWCELRNDFRHFRIDRIGALRVLDEALPRSRHSLLGEWRIKEGIPPP